ncbi:MAG TPA: HAMP domain-containing sensor histidine kinase, partial [Burkholderiales bacterium]|nr:HAMP domain-containing sensor histidine kinase [Burkholderiales bacterium]
LVSDYQILRLVVLEFLEEHLSRPLYQRETLAVGVFIDDAISASIACYIDHRDAHQRTLESDRVQALADLSRRKDEFLAILGHELRNPLAPIRNSLMVIRKVLSDPPPAVASSLDVMERQSAQLLRLVDDLRDVARINRGEFELRTSRFDLRTAIEQALQMTQPLINAKAHQLSVSLPEAALEIEADLSRVTQIVSNLLTNAAKYTEPGGQLSLRVEGDAREVVIRVRDNGIGIAPDMLDRVFELFARVEQPEGAGPDGLGIGLSLVQRLAQQHGGTITAHSRGLGHGSELIVRLPRKGGNAALTDPSQQSRLLITPIHTDSR